MKKYGLKTTLAATTVALAAVSTFAFDVDEYAELTPSLESARVELTATSEKSANATLTYKQVTQSRKLIDGDALCQEPLSAPIAKAEAGSQPVYAVMMYSSAWTEDTGTKKGIYSIPTDGSSTTPTSVFVDANVFTSCGYAVGKPDIYLFGQQTKTYDVITSLRQYNIDTKEWKVISTLSSDYSTRYYEASDAAYNAVTTEVYASIQDTKLKTWTLYRIGTEDKMTFSKVMDLDAPYLAMSFDSKGLMFAVTNDGKFITYDLATHKFTTISENIPVSTKVTSGTMSADDTKFYYAVCTETTSALGVIDVATGTFAKLYDFENGEEFVGMYIPSETVQTAAPATATDLTATFKDAELTGKISFVAPQANLDGSVGEGTVNYEVRAGTAAPITGTCEYGATTEVEVTVPASGDVTFTVRLSNEAGTSPVAKLSRWVGFDVPKAFIIAPKVVYSAADKGAKITWSPPTGSVGVNGGFVDRNKFTYTVVRNNDNKVIIENTPEKSTIDYFEAPADLTLYSYNVIIHYEGASSTPVSTNILALGAIRPPFNFDFTVDPMTYFTIIDGNKDYKTWSYSSVYGRVHLSQASTGKTHDDWLVTLPFNLKANTAYNISFDTFTGAANTKQLMEVKLGKGNTADDMTVLTIMEKQEFDNVEKTPLHISYDIIVEEDGLYYIGFHALSEASQNYICLKNLKVGEGVALDGPLAIADLTAAPDMDGALKCDLTLTAPNKKLNGQTLTRLTAIELYANDVLIHTFNAPSPGSKLTYTHTPAERGAVAYTAFAKNDAGTSQPAAASAFIGLDVATGPASATMVENSPGNVTMSWTEVTKDVNGKNLDPSTLTYVVMELDQNALKWNERVAGIKGLSYTMQARKLDEEQDFVSYAIGTDNEYGRSKYRTIYQVPIGVPYALPFCESFTNGSLHNTFLTRQIAGDGYARWYLGTNSTIQGMVPSDSDNGYAYMSGEKVGDKSGFYSGKVDLSTATNPIMTVNYVEFKDDHNKVGVNIVADGVEKNVAEWEVDGPVATWKTRKISLKDYIGKTVQFIVYGELHTSTRVFVDRFEIADYPQTDIYAKDIAAPVTLLSGTTSVVRVLVENAGEQPIDNYTVSLYANGVLLEEQESTATLDFKGTDIYTFNVSANPLTDKELSFYAVVSCTGDANADNNKTRTVVTEVLLPTLPAPQNVKASVDDTKTAVTLIWEDAAASDIAEAYVTETCEGLKSFEIEDLGAWTSIDADKSKSSYFASITVPHMGTDPFGFMVFDTSSSDFNSTFNGHSGDKYFMAFTNDAKACDDWLISPQLSGKEQTISFFARGYHPNYLESFEVLYSTTDKETASFKAVRMYSNVGNTLTEYNVELPAGAKYFAIRCTSKEGMMFIVDDITYQGAEELTVKGYNVYRNGELLDENVQEKTFADNVKEKASHTYNVTAVYNYGESKASDDAVVDLSGVEDAMAAGFNVSVVDRAIVITGADGCNVAIYNTAGVEVFAAVSNGNTSYQAAQGIYLVKVADSTYKVVVK